MTKINFHKLLICMTVLLAVNSLNPEVAGCTASSGQNIMV